MNENVINIFVVLIDYGEIIHSCFKVCLLKNLVRFALLFFTRKPYNTSELFLRNRAKEPHKLYRPCCDTQ